MGWIPGMIFPRVLQKIPHKHIRVREPVQMPSKSFRFLRKPYLLAVERSRILFGPGDHTVMQAVTVIPVKVVKSMGCKSFPSNIHSIAHLKRYEK